MPEGGTTGAEVASRRYEDVWIGPVIEDIIGIVLCTGGLAFAGGGGCA